MSGTDDDRFHVAMASPTRRGVLAAVAAASGDGDGVDAATLAARLHLHVTTVRFHLERLEAVELVWRVPSTERRRGRPRVLFAAHGTPEQGEAPSPHAASRRSEVSRGVDAAAAAGSELEADAARRSQTELIRVLAAALAERSDRDGDRGHGAAIDAGRAWGRAHAVGDRAPDGASAIADRALDAAQPDADWVPEVARTEALLRTLDSLGFAPERREREVLLHACPFRDAARQHPDVVCGAHLGLMRELMADRDGAVRLQPMVSPNLCVVSLGQGGPASARQLGASPTAALARHARRSSPARQARGSGAA